jgi:hypothetical protein
MTRNLQPLHSPGSSLLSRNKPESSLHWDTETKAVTVSMAGNSNNNDKLLESVVSMIGEKRFVTIDIRCIGLGYGQMLKIPLGGGRLVPSLLVFEQQPGADAVQSLRHQDEIETCLGAQ